MKKVLLYFTCIISLLINCFILEVDDFNFKIIDSPLGSQYQLDAVKKLDGSYLIATQWWKKIYDSLNIYKIYFSLDDGNTWELHDQNAYTIQYSNYIMIPYMELLFRHKLILIYLLQLVCINQVIMVKFGIGYVVVQVFF